VEDYLTGYTVLLFAFALGLANELQWTDIRRLLFSTIERGSILSPWAAG
jgi:hypothetical protein